MPFQRYCNSSLFSYISLRANIFHLIDFPLKYLHHKVSCGVGYQIKVVILNSIFIENLSNDNLTKPFCIITYLHHKVSCHVVIKSRLLYLIGFNFHQKSGKPLQGITQYKAHFIHLCVQHVYMKVI